MRSARDVLDYWFGSGPLEGERLRERTRFWFGGDGAEAQAARDADIREKLGPMLERAAAGEYAGWASSPRRRLALIILFDQVPRNIHRGSAKAFAFDDRALALSVEGLQLAADQALQPVERLFFYLPLEHAESLEAQDASVQAFERLVTESPDDLRRFVEYTLEYARGHREIIGKFGRFPHRNAVLGRADTPEEAQWLASGADRFGQ